jgi:murein DD-endopeptidase MepM/ murein hydrolase activator NlpD
MAAIVPYRPVTRSAGGALTKQQDGSVRLKKTVINIEKVLQKKRKTTKKLNEQEVATTRFATEQKTRTAAESAMESGSTFSMPMLKKVPSFAVDAFSRIMNFLGIYLIGWITDKLPKIINAIKDLNQRIQKMGQIVTNMANRQLQIVSSMANLIAAKTKQIATLDFGDKSGDVKKATEQLDAAYDSMQQDYDMAVQIFNAPLGSFPVGSAPGEPPLPGDSSFSKEITEDERKALAVLAKYESGAAGYNAVNQIGVAGGRGVVGFSGDIRRMKQHGGRSLEDMTIGEIKALQREESITNAQWIAKGKLHAVGRYQFIGNTLPGVAARAGFSDDTKFTKAVQDKMAIQLIKERGISPWVGPSDKATAAERALVRKVQLGQGGGNGGSVIRPHKLSPTIMGGGRVLTSGMGMRGLALSPGMHMGVDISGRVGEPLQAFTDGVVEATGSQATGYGNYINWIDSSGVGHFYAHMNKPAFVRKGTRVKKGTILGELGSTGRSSGPHLHWETATNPRDTGMSKAAVLTRFNPLSKYGIDAPFGGTIRPDPSLAATSSPSSGHDLSPLAPEEPPLDMAKLERLIKKRMAEQQAQQLPAYNADTSSGYGNPYLSNPATPLNSMLFNSLAFQ